MSEVHLYSQVDMLGSERLTDFSQVGMLGLGYKCVNFGAEKSAHQIGGPKLTETELQGYVGHKKHSPPRTLQQDYT